MKIAWVVYSFREGSSGGVERYAQDLASALSQQGHSIDIYAHRVHRQEESTLDLVHLGPINHCHSREGGNPDQPKVNKASPPYPTETPRLLGTLRVIPVGSFLPFAPFRWFSFRRRVSKMLQHASYDLVHDFWYGQVHDVVRVGGGLHRNYLAALRRAGEMEESGSREVEKSRSQEVQKSESPKVGWKDRAMIRLQDDVFLRSSYTRIVCISQLVKREIQEAYPSIPESKLEVVYNGIDLKRFDRARLLPFRDEIRQGLGLGDKDPVFLFVGTGFERKGLGVAIRFVAELVRKGYARSRLVVIGRGRIRKYQRLAHQWGLSTTVLFLGPQKEVEKFYAASDFFLFPSFYDAFGTVVLEAMSCGCIPLVSQQTGAAEVIEHGQNGFLFDPFELLNSTDPMEWKKLESFLEPLLDLMPSSGESLRQGEGTGNLDSRLRGNDKKRSGNDKKESEKDTHVHGVSSPVTIHSRLISSTKNILQNFREKAMQTAQAYSIERNTRAILSLYETLNSAGRKARSP